MIIETEGKLRSIKVVLTEGERPKYEAMLDGDFNGLTLTQDQYLELVKLHASGRQLSVMLVIDNNRDIEVTSPLVEAVK